MELPGESDNSLRSASDGHVVSRLPSEILVEIFSYSIPPVYSRRFPTLSRLSSVCSRWRAIVHATPAFWARPDMHKPELTTWMVARAQDMPLLLYLDKDVNQPQDSPTKSLVSRAGELYVRSDRLRASKAMWICVRHGAPNLTVLDVELTRDVPPRGIRAGATPRLRRLRVSGWPRFLYCGLDKLSGSLTELSLEHLKGAHAPTSDQLCGVLQSLPNLHTLVLYDFGAEPDELTSDPPPDTPTLTLAHLRRLEVTDTPPICLQLLARLSYPPSAHVTIATSTDTDPHALPRLAALLQCRLPAARRRLTVDSYQLALDFAPARVRLTYIDRNVSRLDALLAFLTRLPPALLPLHELRLPSRPAAPSPPPARASRFAEVRAARERTLALELLHTALLPHVAHISASGHMAHVLCTALGAAPDFADARVLAQEPICTDTLEFTGAPVLAREDVVLLRRYLDFLERDRAHRFRRLAFRDCSGLTLDDVSILEDIVDEVVFSAL